MKRRRIFYGWWIVSAGVGINVLVSMFFVWGFSALFIPWREEFGWSRALLGGVIAMSRLESGLAAPVAGWFIDRFGPRRMMFLGLGMMGLGFLVLSRINTLLMLYVVFIGLMAAGQSIGSGRAVQVAVANWFVKYRGRAMGLLVTGNGLGGSLVFLFAMVIQALGWRGGVIFAAFVIWAIGLPLAWVVRHKPEDMGLRPDGERATALADPPDGQNVRETKRRDLGRRPFWARDPRPETDMTAWEALRTPAFWLMALMWALWAATPTINTVYLAPFLAEELKVEYLVALSAVSFFAFVSIFGRLGFGFLADYVNIRVMVAGLLMMEGAGIFLFAHVQTLAQVPLYVILFALPHGGLIAVRAVLQGYFFGKKRFGTIGGLLTAVDLPATIAAPIILGWMADVLPSGFRLGFRIVAVTLFVAAVAILMARRPQPPVPAQPHQPVGVEESA